VKKFATACAAVVLSTTIYAAPALADGGDGGWKSAAWMPVRALGVGTGMVIGTPVAVTREVAVHIREFNAAAADKVGGKEHFPPNVMAAFYSVPVGIFVGSGLGVYRGSKTALKHGWEKPFSVDSMSLGSEYEE